MYKISVEQHFEAAHALRGYQGKCENLHGHRFLVIAKVRASKLNELGLAYDFLELKRQMGEIISKLDHQNLNETPPFDKMNPSSENIARTIYDELKAKLGATPVTLRSVEVWESPENRVSYNED